MKPSHLFVLAFLVGSLALAADSAIAAASYDAPTHDYPAEVQKQVDLAYLTLNGAVSSGHLQTLIFNMTTGPGAGPGARGGGARGGGAGLARTATAKPTRVFDQLYYLGQDFVAAWALVTSDGIILIDTLNNAEDAQQNIEGGLRALGLDPKQIKYILVTHGHDDHFGGARYLQEKYGAHVLMSAADWEFAARGASNSPKAGLPVKDMVVTDGQMLSLGTTSIKMYLSPGHTPAPISSIFTVTHRGQPHVVSFFGGYGIQFIDKDPKQGGFATMRESLQRFAKLSADAGADIILANHPFNDGTLAKLQTLSTQKSASANNPWVSGQETVLRFYAATISAVNAVETFYSIAP